MNVPHETGHVKYDISIKKVIAWFTFEAVIWIIIS